MNKYNITYRQAYLKLRRLNKILTERSKARKVIINIIRFWVKNSICSLYPINTNSNPDKVYDTTNNTFTYNPAEITYNSNNTAYVYNSSIPSYESFYDVSYYYSNSTITQPIYANTFSASGNVSFSLNIDNQSFTNVHSVLLELPDGIYAYNFTIGNKTSQGILYVNNKDTNTILAISTYSNNYVLYLYLGIVFLSLSLIGKYTRGFVVSYTLSGLLFVFIGYKEHIEFFTQNLIILIITFLALLFTYKVVMEGMEEL